MLQERETSMKQRPRKAISNPDCPLRGRAEHGEAAFLAVDPLAIARAFLEEQEASVQVGQWLDQRAARGQHATS